MIFFQAFDFQAMANEKTTTTSMQLASAPTTTVDVVVSAEPHIERQSGSQLPQASKAQQQVATSLVSGIRDKSKFFKLKINRYLILLLKFINYTFYFFSKKLDIFKKMAFFWKFWSKNGMIDSPQSGH